MTGISHIGVIGEGKMGTSIFHYLTGFDYQLSWICSPQSDPEILKKQLLRRAERSVRLGIMDENSFNRIAGIIITPDLTISADCDLLIEAIPENLTLKQDLFARLSRIVKSGAILTTNSSSFVPSELAPSQERLRSMAGLHFFFPVNLKNLIEITLPNQAEGETRQALEHFSDRIGRRYLILEEQNSAVLNRIFLEVQVEAMRIVTEGHCTLIQMDKLVRTKLFPFGVFDFCDSVGLDTMLVSVQNYVKRYPDTSHYQLFINTLGDLVKAGKYGLKRDEGFHSYPVDWDLVTLPDDDEEIHGYLRQIWLSSVRRFTAQSHIPIEDMDFAVREYFGLDRGPFEMGK